MFPRFLRPQFMAMILVAAMSPLVVSSEPIGQIENGANGGDLASELEKLRSKVAELEAALGQQHQLRYGSASPDRPGSSARIPAPTASAPAPSATEKSSSIKKTMGAKGMQKMAAMKKMAAKNDSQESSSDQLDGEKKMSGGMKKMGMGKMGGDKMGKKMMGGDKMAGGMGMRRGMMGRGPAMGSMKTMSGLSTQSSLPGFPGVSHLYHIGETGFFLDHAEHITLSEEQQLKLNRIKESALLAAATSERNSDEAEQMLWTLTAEAQPDIKKIEAKAKEIAQLNVDQRIAFIRSVGMAAAVLTADQRQSLVGVVLPQNTDGNQ